MYPSGELDRLAQRKKIIQARITVRRWECAAAVIELARPVSYVDRAVEMWRRFSPFLKFLAIPTGFVFTRLLGRRTGKHHGRKRGRIATILTLLPLIIRGLKVAKAVQAAYASGRHAPKSARPANAPVSRTV